MFISPEKIIQIPTTIEDFLEQGQYHMPQNTPDTSVVDAIEAIGEFCYLIIHPKALWCKVVPYSKAFIFFTCLASLSIYAITKNKKAGKLTISSPFVYLLVRYLDLIIQRR